MLNKLPSGVESDSKTTALITAMTGTSLVARWLRICLLMPAPWVLSLAQELGSQVPWGNSGNAPQTTEPKHSRPHAPEQEKPLQLEARTQLESKPSLTPTRESPCTTMKTQSSQTQNAYNLKNNNDHGNDNS